MREEELPKRTRICPIGGEPLLELLLPCSMGSRGPLWGHRGCVRCLADLGDDRIASGSWDATIRIWNVSKLTCDQVLEGHRDRVRVLATLDERTFASGSWDRTVRVWRLSGAQWSCLHILHGHTGRVWALLALDGLTLASGSWDAEVRVWSAEHGVCLRQLRGHTDAVMCLAWSSGRNCLISGSQDHSLKVWTVTACKRTLEGHTKGVKCLVLLDDDRVASGSYDSSLRVWELASGDAHVLEGHRDTVEGIVALRDNRMASASWDKTVRIWAYQEGVYCCNYVLEGHSKELACIACLGDILVSGGWDAAICLWCASTGQLLKSYSDHTSSVWCLLFHGVGSRCCLWSGSEDSSVRLWDLRLLDHLDKNLTSESAHEMMREHDVGVTDKSDKENDLAKLTTINSRVKRTFSDVCVYQDRGLSDRDESRASQT